MFRTHLVATIVVRFCLERLGVVQAEDHTALVIMVFWRCASRQQCVCRSLLTSCRYIVVMRKLQSTYWLEPAGSHGVWGLDDYHFLPFLFGSAQLKGVGPPFRISWASSHCRRGHKYIKPKSIHDNELVDEYAKDYMYLACIKFINSVSLAVLHPPSLRLILGR